MAYIGRQPSYGNYQSVDDISSGFNGSSTNFSLQSSGADLAIDTAEQLIISLGGVIQQPGVDFLLPAANTIQFTTPPSSNSINFFGLALGQSLDVGSPTDGSVNNTKVASGYSLTTNWTVVSSPTTLSNGDQILADTSGGSFTLTLPNVSALSSARIRIADGQGTWKSKSLVVVPTATNIEGDSQLICDVENADFELVYNGTEWKIF